MRRRSFSPSRDPALEPRCLLTAAPPTDPGVIAMTAEVQQIVTAGSATVGISIPAMGMTDKDAEVRQINDLRDKFNVAIDAVIAVDQNEVVQLNDVVARIDAKVATIDPTTAAGLESATEYLNLRAQVVADVAAAQNHLNALAGFKVTVNTMADEIIADIKGTVFVMMGVSTTQYTNDAYAAWD